MNADQLIQYLSWAVYLAVFGSTAVAVIRRPRRVTIDLALMFATTTVIILLAVVEHFVPLSTSPLVSVVSTALLLATPFFLLRLVDDFTDVPPWLQPVAAVVVLVLVVALTGLPPAPWLTLVALAYLIGVLAYATAALFRAARRASGVTRRRLDAAAVGSIGLILVFLFDGLAAIPGAGGLARPLSNLAGLLSASAYFLGFAPPGIVRRAWQEPELRAFLGRAARLPRLPTTDAIRAELEQGAARALGAPAAAIGLWDAAAEVLRFDAEGGPMAIAPNPAMTSSRAFLEQRALLTDDVVRDNPDGAANALRWGARALLAAPITAGSQRLGVLTVYAPRPPIFAEDDLSLIQLLADQAAVVLESRALIDEASRVQAREEVARLKEDFLSAAAHDLKTPLTTLVGQLQLLERRALRLPDAPADLAGIQRAAGEAGRLRTLVLELLDAARAEQGGLVGIREPVDLVAIAQEVCRRYDSTRHPCRMEAPAPVVGDYDPVRMQQLLENLVENAVKYSPEGGPIETRVWAEAGWNHVAVADQGIGIPADDLPHVFERFHRGTNVDDRRFAGMGLGLYICRGIVEQHGGRLTVGPSTPRGTTFHIALPVDIAAAVPVGAAHAG